MAFRGDWMRSNGVHLTEGVYDVKGGISVGSSPLSTLVWGCSAFIELYVCVESLKSHHEECSGLEVAAGLNSRTCLLD